MITPKAGGKNICKPEIVCHCLGGYIFFPRPVLRAVDYGIVLELEKVVILALAAPQSHSIGQNYNIDTVYCSAFDPFRRYESRSRPER